MEFKRIVNLRFLKGLFLFGPRQTGKSYWLSKKFPKAVYYDLLKSDLFLRFSRFPHTFREEILAEKRKKLVIVDEIQKIPLLLNEVHYLMEKHKIPFILTGSSARKLKRGGANMLGGRALYRQLFPLVSKEIPQFNLSQMIRFGSLPSMYSLKNPKPALRSYVQTYLKEEIQAEGLVRRLHPFSLFLELAAKTNTQLINYSNIASDVGLSSKTIKEYYLILEDTFVGRLLPPYKKTSNRKSVSMHKFYFFDIGIRNALINNWTASPNSRDFGPLFEHFIFNELYAYLHYTDSDHPIHFWRSKNGQEVDFVIGEILAVEVKASSYIQKRDLKNLKVLSAEVQFKHKIIVSLEDRTRLVENKILILPYKIFLKKLWNKEFV